MMKRFAQRKKEKKYRFAFNFITKPCDEIMFICTCVLVVVIYDCNELNVLSIENFFFPSQNLQ